MADTHALVGKTYCIKTFGCQMNLHESERVAGLLDSFGAVEVEHPQEAEIMLYMTCCVREKADTHLYGEVSHMVSTPPPASGRRIIAIGGCIAQRDGLRIREQIPNVDVVFGTQALSNLPDMLISAFEQDTGELIADIAEDYVGFSTDLPSKREQEFHAWVPIMYGCDNFCTFCIVPHVRGRERSREIEQIVQESEHLVADGVREISLLGQNVNSYGRNIYGEPRFADLLRAVGETGIERLRFTSSNPKDLNDDVIRAMADVPAVLPHLHLAVQSGSSKILKAMNRKYSREEYSDLVRRIREAIPGIAISTDIIVGFPGETEEDFLQTLSLVDELKFSSAFTFIYSKRDGTPAANMVDTTPKEVIQDRFDRLAQRIAEHAHNFNESYLHKDVEVLVEGMSKRGSTLVGHSQYNQTVHFEAPVGVVPQTLVGKIATIHVDEARTWYLRGQLQGEAR